MLKALFYDLVNLIQITFFVSEKSHLHFFFLQGKIWNGNLKIKNLFNNLAYDVEYNI